jgi:hypothetical protein
MWLAAQSSSFLEMPTMVGKFALPGQTSSLGSFPYKPKLPKVGLWEELNSLPSEPVHLASDKKRIQCLQLQSQVGISVI